jgi:hypothetical protein
MSGGAMFGVNVNLKSMVRKPNPKLIGIITDRPLHPASEIFGPSMAIVMAIIRDAWKIALPPRLAPGYVRTHTTTQTGSGAGC